MQHFRNAHHGAHSVKKTPLPALTDKGRSHNPDMDIRKNQAAGRERSFVELFTSSVFTLP